MKKSIKKLELNKRTISNLNDVEMSNYLGGRASESTCCSYTCTRYVVCGGGKTYNGNNCPTHKTC